MGQEVVRAICSSDEIELVLAVDHEHVGESVRQFTRERGPDIQIESKLGAGLDRVQTDVLVDFTLPRCAAQHALQAIQRKVSPVIGTTGMSDTDLKEIALSAKENGTPAIYCPNFAIGAVLMMKFSQMAARYMPNCEIIELHHDKKEDAPSGTAIHTAQLISDARIEPIQRKRSMVTVEGVRGGVYQDTHIHSIRLPGLIAHQRVMFGGAGETLTIQHDSMDRVSFMEGVKLAIREVRNLEGFVTGLDKILF